MRDQVRVLHLEDNPDDCELVRTALVKENIAPVVQVASTREQFLAALSRGGFDLVLSDSGLPGMDGMSAFEATRSKFPDIPFLFVSGRAVEDRRDDFAALDRVDYIPKSELDRLAPAVERALAAAATRSSRRLMTYRDATEKLIAVVQELSLARNLPTVMSIVRRAARELTGADGATFVIREGDHCYYAEENAIGPLWKGKRFPITACISGWAMLNRQATVVEDIYADSRIPADAYRPTFVKSLAMVPIRTASPVGAIGNYWAKPYRASAEEVKLLQALADSTSIALENVQLYNDLEQRVRERTSQLESANKELEAFSSSVSHDLRAPVRAIEGFSKLLMHDCGESLNEQGRDYLQRIHRANTRMGQLIDDLLKLSRISRIDIRREIVDLTKMAKEITADLHNASPDRPTKFDIAEGIVAHGDPALLRVVMENLLSNAWKYTAKQLRARITVSSTREPKGPTIYRVQDNGAGFDMTHAGKLFGAFQRLHSESEFPGTGVGLATVQRIVHKHGGRIWAEAEVGQGAIFSFTLS